MFVFAIVISIVM